MPSLPTDLLLATLLPVALAGARGQQGSFPYAWVLGMLVIFCLIALSFVAAFLALQAKRNQPVLPK